MVQAGQTEFTKLQAQLPELTAQQKASLGSMLGAFVGDSLGSFLEFKRGTQTKETVEWAMTMPGGGCWKVQPGQVTDDSELAMCQLRGLLAGGGKFDLFQHCKFYGQWIAMDPFDIGMTTRSGLSPQAVCLDSPDPSKSHEAAKRNPGNSSMSNGSLMRITPLANWAQHLAVDDIYEVVNEDVSLMHSKVEMWEICTAYCLAIKALVQHAGQDNRGQLAFQAAREFGERDTCSSTVREYLQQAEQLHAKVTAAAEGTLDEDGFFGLISYNVQYQMGWVKHGFILAMYSLLRAKDFTVDKIYDHMMQQTTMLCGDSDTNCAIVGGIIGAYVGIENIDTAKVQKVLECPVERGRCMNVACSWRPKFIQPSKGCIDEMIQLLTIAPTTLEKVTEYVDQGYNFIDQ